MTHDWSHLDFAAAVALTRIVPHETVPGQWTIEAVATREAILSTITPSDLAALLAEKCPGWVAVHRDANDAQCRAIMRLWLISDQEPVGGDFRLAEGYWKKFLAMAPKLGEDN